MSFVSNIPPKNNIQHNTGTIMYNPHKYKSKQSNRNATGIWKQSHISTMNSSFTHINQTSPAYQPTYFWWSGKMKYSKHSCPCFSRHCCLQSHSMPRTRNICQCVLFGNYRESFCTKSYWLALWKSTLAFQVCTLKLQIISVQLSWSALGEICESFSPSR